MPETLIEALAKVGNDPSKLQLTGTALPERNGKSEHLFSVYEAEGIYVITQDQKSVIDVFNTRKVPISETESREYRNSTISAGTNVEVSDLDAYLNGFELVYFFEDTQVFRKHAFHELVARTREALF